MKSPHRCQPHQRIVALATAICGGNHSLAQHNMQGCDWTKVKLEVVVARSHGITSKNRIFGSVSLLHGFLLNAKT